MLSVRLSSIAALKELWIIDASHWSCCITEFVSMTPITEPLQKEMRISMSAWFKWWCSIYEWRKNICWQNIVYMIMHSWCLLWPKNGVFNIMIIQYKMSIIKAIPALVVVSWIVKPLGLHEWIIKLFDLFSYNDSFWNRTDSWVSLLNQFLKWLAVQY